jgi:peptidoglycan hydrolase-like protein with peptidoglycan-binding domain
MNMKKNISEEVENMKYLLGYKRGVIISEQQDTDNDIDPKLVASTEQSSNVVPTNGDTTTNTQTSQPIKMGVKNPRVQILQQLLNTNFQSGLVADGLYGPKTANAIYKNITSINKQQIKPIGDDIKPAGVATSTQQTINSPTQK